MSKAFTSILIIFSILFLYSAKLSGDLHRHQHLKESINEEENKLTSASESDFIDERRESNQADIPLINQETREQHSSIKYLDQGLDKLIRDIANFGVLIDNSFEVEQNLEKIETPISKMTEENKSFEEIAEKNEESSQITSEAIHEIDLRQHDEEEEEREQRI